MTVLSRWGLATALVFAAAVAPCSPLVARAAAPPSVAVDPRPMPEFPGTGPEAWINSGPIRLADLRGKVVLIDIWTTV